MKKAIHLCAVGGLLLLVLVLATRMVAGSRDAVISLPGIASNPVPHIPVNPFAIYGSPLGKSISAMMIDEADVLHHAGLENEFAPDDYLLFTARGLAWMHAGLIPEEDAPLPSSTLDSIVAARSNRNRAVFAAYLLDPANFAAMEILTDWENIRWPKNMVARVPEFVEWKERYGSVAPAALAREIALFSLAHYDTKSGYWPEQTLAAARTLQTLFVQDAFLGNPVNKAAMAAEIRRLVGDANRQRKRLEELGLWQRRDMFSIEWFDGLRSQCESFASALEQHSD